MKQRIAFLQGVNDEGKASVMISQGGKLQLILDGACNTCDFLKDPRWETDLTLLVPNDKRGNLTIKRPAVIFNEISDPDSHQIALSRANEIRNFFKEAPCINEPERVAECTREKLESLLDGIPKLKIPKTIKVTLESRSELLDYWREHFDSSIIVRRAGTHGGAVTAVAHDPGDLSNLDAIAINGGDFYLSEFINFKSADGLYRKYRIIVVDGRVFIRHLFISNHWLLHSSSRSYMEERKDLQEEEASMLQNFDEMLKPEIEERCQQIADRVGLDYFGMDCTMLSDGRLVLFEANANMNVLLNNQKLPNIWQPKIDLIIEALRQLILQKLDQ